MSVRAFIDIIRTLDHDATPEEIADVLWLLVQTEQQGDGTVSAQEIHIPDQYQLETTQEPGTSQSQVNSTTAHHTQTEPVSRIAPQNTQSSSNLSTGDLFPQAANNRDNKLGISGVPIKTPAATPLSGALEIARALRPLQRRVPSRTFFTLDEQETAQQSAEQRALVPILRPERTRWLAVDLVVDLSASMIIWRSTIEEFRQLLLRQGAFRDVRIWGLDTEAATEQLSLYAGQRLNWRSTLSHGINELRDLAGQRLILLVSDAISTGWHSGKVARAIAAWGQTNPVVLVQVLPSWLWTRTALGKETEAKLTATSPGVPNMKLNVSVTDEWSDEPRTSESDVPVPVVTLAPEVLGRWAQMVVGRGEVRVSGIILDTTSRNRELSPTRSLSAEQRVERFLRLASPTARELALLLAAVPITLPIINLIQASMLPKARQGHVAEVLLSGLMKQNTLIDQVTDPDNIEYVFLEGVRELLLQQMPIDRSLEVITLVSAHVERNMRHAREMQSIVAVPGNRHFAQFEAERKVFAKIRSTLLRGMGYSTLAELLEQITQSQQSVMPESAPGVGSTEIIIPHQGFVEGSADENAEIFDFSALIAAAKEARERAYAPYSQFAVGAAVLTRTGKIFPGCNIENASYGMGMCAERVALISAYAAGERDIVALAVIMDTHEVPSPCGECRQVIAELMPQGKVLLLNLKDAQYVTTPSRLLTTTTATTAPIITPIHADTTADPKTDVAPNNGNQALPASEENRTSILSSLLSLLEPSPEADYDAALRRYLNHLYATHTTIDLRGINSRPKDMPLSELFIALTLHEPPPNELRRSGVRRFMEKVREILNRQAVDEQEPRSVGPQPISWPQALRHPRLVVVGAPGSGKTTLLYYTAVRLAEIILHDNAEELSHLGLGAPDLASTPPVPLVLPLRHLESYISKSGSREVAVINPRLLFDCLANYYGRFDLNLPPDFFSRLCEAGHALLLLDGLDDVVRHENRAFVSAIIREFATRYPSCRYVVTMRVGAYQGDTEIGASFHTFIVADLDAEQQQRFIANWSRSLNRLLYNLSGQELERATKRYVDDLWHAIEANEGVRELAASPLLLTVVAVLFYNTHVLPENRAMLYDECIKVMLRGGPGKTDRAAQQISILGGRSEFSLSLDSKSELLGAIAYAVHQRGEDGVFISRAELVRLIADHLRNLPRADEVAQAFVDELPVHIGLLDEREPNRFRFSHLSLQEFLAARHIAESDRWDELLTHYH